MQPIDEGFFRCEAEVGGPKFSTNGDGGYPSKTPKTRLISKVANIYSKKDLSYFG